MFEQSVMPRRKARPWTYMVSMLLEIALLAGAMLVPLLRVEALPPVKLGCDCRLPPRGVTIVSAQSAAPGGTRSSAALVVPRPAVAKAFVAPGAIPRGVAMIEEAAPMLGQEAAAGGPGRPGIPGGIDDPSHPGAFRPVAPPAPAEPALPRRPVEPVALTKPEPVRVGGKVRPPRLIHEVRPGYPPLAVMSRTSGTVRIEAVLARDGTIQSMRVISGHPLLVQAAVEAVRQWRYEPTQLNGVPTEVALAIDVNFTLRQ